MSDDYRFTTKGTTALTIKSREKRYVAYGKRITKKKLEWIIKNRRWFTLKNIHLTGSKSPYRPGL